MRVGRAIEEDLKQTVPPLMAEYDVPGVAVAVLHGGSLVATADFGVRRAGESSAVGRDTVFQVASLSKPVVAYGALALAKQGRLDLDRPLSDYLDEPYVDDPRLSEITARRVLSHSSGFPNWRPGRWTDNPQPLRILFDPGSDFRYSGEGYVYLQRVLEKITGRPLDSILRAEVLEPLGMNSSSFVWQERFESLFAAPHDGDGSPLEKSKPKHALAAGTLHTTARDYARLLRALVRPDPEAMPLGPEDVAAMLTQTSTVPERFGASLAWSLGWGLEKAPEETFFWQWGDDGPFKAFAAGSVASGDAVVVLTNGDWGLDVARRVVERVLGERSFLDFRMVRYRPRD